MTNEQRAETFHQVRSIRSGLITFQDGFRIQFIQPVPAWIANAEALKIREALDSGDWFVANFDGFRVLPAVESFL